MRGHVRGVVIEGVALMLVIAACTTTSSPSSTTTPVTTIDSGSDSTVTTTTSPTTTTTSLAIPETQDRWIAISGDQFIDTRTGDVFVPRGVNLLMKLGGGGGDRMFERYDPDWVESQLDAISGLGFNTVRFFLDMCMSCTSTSSGIRDDYLDNLTDLLIRLEQHGLVAMPTSNDVPDPGYSERLSCCTPFGGYRNSLYLSPEGHAIAVEYWTDLLEGIEQRGAPTHHLLGWELANEQFVLRDVPPIPLEEGSVTTADGVTYDLADDDAVAEMVVNNLRAYVTTVGDAIRAIDDGALITMGFFSPEDPDAGRVSGDNRWVVPDEVLQKSSLDFVDLHAYNGLGGTWSSIGAAYRLTGDPLGYPLLLGEFGSFEQAFPDPEEAAANVARWQANSCDLGFGGWLVWFWGADKDDEVVTADSHGAVLARALSPDVRPDPCDPGPYASANLALDQPVTASAEENEEYSAARAVDGSDATWWSAAEEPPQWIEVDLGQNTTVGRVEILIGHVSPPGPQTHRVYLRADGEAGKGELAGEVSADASQGDWLTIAFEPVAGVRYVRVETTRMDGWVILHEVQVFAD
ncbi:MAG: discoidin domain-containing protein [Acidimicrobiia bacterium]